MPKHGLNKWQKFLKANAGMGKSVKTLARAYKSSSHMKAKKGRGLSGGMCAPCGMRGGAEAKGALAALLKGLNANINVK